jgi:hypothetical protein
MKTATEAAFDKLKEANKAQNLKAIVTLFT